MKKVLVEGNRGRVGEGKTRKRGRENHRGRVGESGMQN